MRKIGVRRKTDASAATAIAPTPRSAVGVSRRSWAHAFQAAVKQLTNVAPRVTGVDVTRTHAVIAAGKIVEYHVHVCEMAASHASDAVPHTVCCEPW